MWKSFLNPFSVERLVAVHHSVEDLPFFNKELSMEDLRHNMS